MPIYKRFYEQGGLYFFTVNLQHRSDNDLLVRYIDELYAAIARVQGSHPFKIHAWIVLNDHMHCIWEMPQHDSDFSIRWRLIKRYFSSSLPKTEFIPDKRKQRLERGIWQRRFWEHLIRDEQDYWNHVNYIHNNPVKHGYVSNVKDWPYSTYHRFVKKGIYPMDWCSHQKEEMNKYDK